MSSFALGDDSATATASGTTTDTSGSVSTSETFHNNDHSDYSDNTWQSITGLYSGYGTTYDWSTVNSAADGGSANNHNDGSIMAGVTSDNYSNTGSQSATASSSTSWDTTTSGADGHGINTSSASGSTTGTETGSFTTPPPGTSITPTPDNQAGYATSNETVSLSGTAISQVTMQQWGDANGGSYSGNYLGTALLSYQTSETQTIDVANNIDSKTATYSGDHGQSQNLTYHETGDITMPSFVHEQWTWDYSASSANDTQVSGSDPGTETTTQGSSGSTSQAATLTLTFWDCISQKWGQSETSSSSSSGGWTSGPTSNTTATGEPGPLGPGGTTPAPHNPVQLLCFAAGTPVRTPGGWKAIEQVLPGDMVLASPYSDPESGVEPKTVVRVYANPPDRLIGVHAGGQVIRTTLHHPFYVRGAGWTGASRLRLGDQLLSHDGSWLSVTETFDNGDVEPVYNLCVQEHHTYFVGKPDWGFSVLVHNESGDMKDAGGQQAAQPTEEAKLHFTQGVGPVRIVGIVGRWEQEDPKPSIKSGLQNLVKALQQVIGTHFGDRNGATSKVYESTDAQGNAGQSIPSQEIADKEIAKMIEAAKNGELGGSQVYRLLLIGHSWGGDKAIEVATLLARSLPGAIQAAIDDPNTDPLERRRLQDFLANWQSKVRVYLGTLDAVDRSKGDKGGATPRGTLPKGDVYDWFNAFEQVDLAKLRGQSYPGEASENTKVAGPHFTLPVNKAVLSALEQWLGLAPFSLEKALQ